MLKTNNKQPDTVTANTIINAAIGQEQHLKLLEMLPTPVYYKDINLRYVMVNTAMEKFIGYSRKLAIGKTALEIFPPQIASVYHGMDTELLEKGGEQIYTTTLPTKHGERDVQLHRSVCYDNQGNKLGIMTVVFDLTEINYTHKKLEQTIKERDQLLKAIHHRVNSNLQILASLLMLQAHKASPETRIVIESSLDRIITMGLIHQQLYADRSITELDFAAYLHKLIKRLYEAHEVSTDRIKIKLYAQPAMLQVDKAIPAALAVNELLTNAFSYAFCDERGVIELIFSKNGSKVAITVADNGCGLPPSTNLNSGNSIGFTLVRSLMGQLEGTLTLLPHKKGTAICLEFEDETN